MSGGSSSRFPLPAPVDHKQIDARTSRARTRQYLEELVETYGIDSDIVKVRVLGQFPSASSLQFIGTGIVRRQGREDD
jgi:hypothetical protein